MLASLFDIMKESDQRAVSRAYDLSPEALAAAYPGRNQSLTQVLSTADARLSGMTEKA